MERDSRFHMPHIAAIIERIAIFLVPLLLGVVCHEVAHGYVAYLQGDSTAKSAGRLTLNPIRHLDPMGSFVFLLTSVIGAFVIGWAKPVPVNPYHFRNPRQGMILVSLAGPAANLLLAVLFSLGLRGLFPLLQQGGGVMVENVVYPLALICRAGLDVNIILALFNLIPLPPLDGSKILAGLLPAQWAFRYMRFERYGLIVVILLLATGVLAKIILPAFYAVRAILL